MPSSQSRDGLVSGESASAAADHARSVNVQRLRWPARQARGLLVKGMCESTGNFSVLSDIPDLARKGRLAQHEEAEKRVYTRGIRRTRPLALFYSVVGQRPANRVRSAEPFLSPSAFASSRHGRADALSQ